MRQISKLVLPVTLLLVAWVGLAQEQATPPDAPVVANAQPAPEYYFALAMATSPDAVQQALQVYADSKASLLLLAVAEGVEVNTDALAKPVLPVGSTNAPGTRLHQQRTDSFLIIEPHAQGVDAGQLQRIRREVRASRWSIAITKRYEPLQDPRMDLVLFHDDPVDIFITTESSLLLGAPVTKMPYGHTLLIGPNPEKESLLQFFGVSESGISPYNPEVTTEVDSESAALP